VQDHYWIEVSQGDSWLPLDPSFPRAVVGESYGVAGARFDQPAEDAYVTIRIRYQRQLLSGEQRLDFEMHAIPRQALRTILQFSIQAH
jgi:hypothetical protein